MLQSDPNDPVRKRLESLCPVMAEIARSCVDTVFNRKCSIDGDWMIAERLRGNFPHNVCLGCGNNDYQALATLGAGNKEVEEFLGVVDGKDILDAFGELLNVNFGMLMDCVEFTGYFGVLTQSIPHYSPEESFFPVAWCSSGVLSTPDGGSLYLGLAMKKNVLYSQKTRYPKM